jgi:hypothetical protein
MPTAPRVVPVDDNSVIAMPIRRMQFRHAFTLIWHPIGIPLAYKVTKNSQSNRDADVSQFLEGPLLEDFADGRGRRLPVRNIRA